jgi:hypothetical protein
MAALATGVLALGGVFGATSTASAAPANATRASAPVSQAQSGGHKNYGWFPSYPDWVEEGEALKARGIITAYHCSRHDGGYILYGWPCEGCCIGSAPNPSTAKFYC